ncbi:gamma subclass chorismate mutase AroQ [Pseudoduganella sp. R-34]|uniref:gamma subclass chorismate mutase AroQ n=1 Tax=unclassified Pseudoduganella TaxID=2637179 RepID=UPI003CF6165B
MKRFTLLTASGLAMLYAGAAYAANAGEDGPLTGAGSASAVGLAEAQQAASAGAPPYEDALLEQLRKLMEQRLALMPDVARYKWRHGGAIEDLARERVIIERFAAQAAALGLPSDWSELFFRAQIDAAKMLQRACTASLPCITAGPVPDLAQETRPRLDALEQPLLLALAAAWPILSNPAKRPRVAVIFAAMDSDHLSVEASQHATLVLTDGSAYPRGK